MHKTDSSEIEEIRSRLKEIEDVHEHLPRDDSNRRDELLEKEHELEHRLAELEDRVVENGAGEAEKKAASHTDITRTPPLPNPEAKPSAGSAQW